MCYIEYFQCLQCVFACCRADYTMNKLLHQTLVTSDYSNPRQHIFFYQFSLIVLTMPHLTPIRIRHDVLALSHEGMRQSAIAGRMGLTLATVNHILQRHAATGTLVPGIQQGPLGRPHLVKTVLSSRWSDINCFISARGLMAWMRNFYGIRAGWKFYLDKEISWTDSGSPPIRLSDSSLGQCQNRP